MNLSKSPVPSIHRGLGLSTLAALPARKAVLASARTFAVISAKIAFTYQFARN